MQQQPPNFLVLSARLNKFQSISFLFFGIFSTTGTRCYTDTSNTLPSLSFNHAAYLVLSLYPTNSKGPTSGVSNTPELLFFINTNQPISKLNEVSCFLSKYALLFPSCNYNLSITCFHTCSIHHNSSSRYNSGFYSSYVNVSNPNSDNPAIGILGASPHVTV